METLFANVGVTMPRINTLLSEGSCVGTGALPAINRDFVGGGGETSLVLNLWLALHINPKSFSITYQFNPAMQIGA